MDLVAERRRRWPEMHVYHYGGYESGALKRLMGRHAVREDDLDVLLRGRVLVDLYSVLRQGVRVSDESYSLKKIEKLYMPAREGPVTHPGFALVSYEEWLETGRASILRDIAAYNRDDCLSVWKLRAWLEERRPSLEGLVGRPLPRPVAEDGAASEKATEASAATTRRDRGAPGRCALGSRTSGPSEQRARWLLSTLLDWHRREDKPQWWRYFFLRDRPMEELVAASRRAWAVSSTRAWWARSSSRYVHRYRYDPEQEHPFKAGDKPLDPSDGGGRRRVVGVDPSRGHDRPETWLHQHAPASPRR